MHGKQTKTGMSFGPVSKKCDDEIHNINQIYQLISAGKIPNLNSTGSPEKTQTFSFFHLWFLFGYYSFCFPFKPVIEQNGICRLQVNKFQKLICLLGVWPLTMISIFTFSVKSFRTIIVSEKLKVWDYFHVLLTLLVIVRYLEFFRIIIMKQKAIESFLGRIQLSTLIFPWKASSQETPKWAKVAHAYFVLIHIANLTEMTVRIATSSTGFVGHGTPSFFQGNIAKGRARFFCDNSEKNLTSPYSSEDIAFGILEIALNIGLTCTCIFVQCLFYGPLPLTFWFAVKGFNNMVSDLSVAPIIGETKEESQHRILAQYANLKMINAELNSLWSGILLPHLIFRTLEIVGIHNKVIAKNSIGFAIFASQTVYMATAVIIMAEGCKLMARFKGWLLDREGGRKYFSEISELEMLVFELDAKTFGIGSPGVYQINYGFISQVVILAVTLFVIGFL